MRICTYATTVLIAATPITVTVMLVAATTTTGITANVPTNAACPADFGSGS